MNKGRVSIALVAACLILLIVGGVIQAQEDSGQFDLAITQVETSPASAGVGDEVSVFVTYENLLSNDIPSELQLDLVVTMTAGESRELLEQCRMPLDLDSLLLANDVQRITLPDCGIIINDPNTYLLRAEIVESGEEVSEGSFSLLPGDIDVFNNGMLSTLVPATATQDGDLPADIARIFAGLAIFFAVMALVAVGTEVAIDSLKVGVGLKRKVTSMEALERMEKYLPGELAALSVSAASREQYRRMMQEMRKTLNFTLKPAADLETMRGQIIQSEFGPAYREAEDLLLGSAPLTGQHLYQVKKRLYSFTNQMSSILENQLRATPDVVQSLRDQLAQEISLFDGDNPLDLLSNLFETLQDIHFWSVQLADGWLQDQQEELFDRSSKTVIDHFDSDVRPLLVGVGFTSESVDQIETELASRLRIVETGVSQTTDTFVSSIKNVLDAVELRRFETQSPARKLWRILRSWQGGLFPPQNFRGLFLPSLVLAFLGLYGLWLAGLDSRSNALVSTISAQIPGVESFSWLPWLILLFAAAFVMVLIFSLIAKSGGDAKPWFVGLYGAIAFSLFGSLFLVALMWLLQAESVSRVTGQLDLLSWSQPWWSWLIIFTVIILLILLIVSQIGKVVYERLVRLAVKDGRMAQDSHKLSGATILHRVETLWNLIRHGFDVSEVDPDSFSQAESVDSFERLTKLSIQPDFQFSAETTAQFIMQRTDQQRDEETSRLRVLRVISIIVGFTLAYLLQIDVLSILSEAFPGVLGSINLTIVSGETLHSWRSWLPVDKAITVGIVLTGFAASAGSAFWHDRLDQLQASKKGAQAAATLLSQASQVAQTVDHSKGK